MADRTANVKIGADAQSYFAELRRAIAATEKFGRATKKAGSNNAFRNIGRSAVAATAGVVSLYGAYSQGKKAIDATTKLAKGTLQLQRVTNLSAQDASRFAAVLQERGIEATKASVSFTALSKQIVAAQSGTAKAADAFKKLGVSQELIKKGDTQAVLLKAADGLSKMGAGAERTALAAQLFGKGYKDLLPLLLLGSKGISEQTALAGKLGAEFSGKSLSSAKQYIAAQREMKTTTLGLQVALGTALMPALTTAMHAITGFVLGFRDGTGAGGLFRDNIKGIAAALAGLAAVLAAGKIAGSLTSIGGLLGAIFSNPYTAVIGGIALAVAALGAAFYLAYTKSKSLQALVAQIAAAVRPAFTSISAAAKTELPKALASAGQVARSISRVFVALKPVLGPLFKAISAVAVRELRGIAPALSFLAARLNNLATVIRALLSTTRTAMHAMSSAFTSMKSTASGVFKAVESAAHAVGNAIRSAFNVAKGGVDALVNAISRLGSALGNLPGLDALKKIKAAISSNRNLGEMNAGVRAKMVSGINSSGGFGATPGLGSSFGQDAVNQMLLQALTYAAAHVQKEKVPKGASKKERDAINGRNTAAQTRADNALNALTARIAALAARAAAIETLRSYLQTIKDAIKAAKLAEIMAPINAAREARAQAADDAGRVSLQSRITQAQADAINPVVQARYRQQAARLQQRIEQAQRAGNLELVDSLTAEKEALDARYGPAYLKGLQDELAQLNENAVERTADTTAQQFADAFGAGLEAAFAAFIAGGSIGNFIAALTAAMAGSGVSLPSIPNAGIPEALGTIAGTDQGGNPTASGGGANMTLTDWVNAWLQSHPAFTKAKPAKASVIGAAFGVSKAAVWAAGGRDHFGGRVKNAANGGYLTRGALTMVGETGPELVMGGKVMSSSRTNRMGSAGMNITINAVGAAANDPALLARELGWQLATR